ncbi:hypothetical protein B0H12DRAFT_1226302 [Mycena haematopus]|nr:hypothetical protein B0H12DRAFT_1226302 [Mycena haematopus]
MILSLASSVELMQEVVQEFNDSDEKHSLSFERRKLMGRVSAAAGIPEKVYMGSVVNTVRAKSDGVTWKSQKIPPEMETTVGRRLEPNSVLAINHHEAVFWLYPDCSVFTEARQPLKTCLWKSRLLFCFLRVQEVFNNFRHATSLALCLTQRNSENSANPGGNANTKYGLPRTLHLICDNFMGAVG